MQVLDPFGRGHMGDVRIGKLGRHYVVIKFMSVDAQLAQLQGA